MGQKEVRIVPGEMVPVTTFPAVAELCGLRRAQVLRSAARCVNARFGMNGAGEHYLTFSGEELTIPEGLVRAEIVFDFPEQLGPFWEVVDRKMDTVNRTLGCR